MNYIALTGRDMPAMARAAEVLLELVTEQQLPVAVALYVNNVQMALALKLRAAPLGIGQLWRIGQDDTRPHLDHLVDVHVHEVGCDGEICQGLRQFRRLLLAHSASLPHQQKTLEKNHE